MATKILLKKSSTAGAVPLSTDLEIGEVALNLADRKLYTKNNSNAIVIIGSSYVGATAPTAPATGDLWYDTGSSVLKSFNGTAWSVSGYTSLTSFGVTATATELNYSTGVTSAIQTQINSKQATITGAATSVVSSDLAVSKALTSDASGKIAAATTTTTELNYLSGVTSAVQTQLNGKAASSHTHTASQITDFTEAAQDAVGTIISGAGIASVAYNDASNTIVVTATEADTLNSVTGRGATTSNAISVGALTATTGSFSGALTVTGNLVVNGTTTTVNSNEVNIGDAIILLNSDETAAPTQNSGIEIERGTLANVFLIWDETADVWTFGDQTVAGIRLDGGSY